MTRFQKDEYSCVSFNIKARYNTWNGEDCRYSMCLPTCMCGVKRMYDIKEDESGYIYEKMQCASTDYSDTEGTSQIR